MITVVHVITRLELGGAQQNTLQTCRDLDRTTFRVALVFGPGGRLDDEAFRLPDTEVIVVPELIRAIEPRRDLRATSRLRTVFSDLLYRHRAAGHPPQAFIVHTHSSKAGLVGRVAARWAQVPKVVHSIHGFSFHAGQPRWKRELFLAAERAAARLTDAFIGVSRANLAEARALGIIGPQHDVRLIRSGMDLSEFSCGGPDDRARLRKSLGLSATDDVVLSIGNFKPQKDPLTTIEAMALLRARRPQAVLLYAGDGVLRPDVERRVKELGLEGAVQLLGWRDDIPQLLIASDVVALSSLFEGLPRSAVQALAARRPFVGTRVDGTPELIRDGRDGFLVEPRDPPALARALEQALVEFRNAGPGSGRVAAWSSDRMVRQQEALYRALIEA